MKNDRYIRRSLEKVVLEKLQNDNKIIILYGARQVGKTTLIRHILPSLSLKSLAIDADLPQYKMVFSGGELSQIKRLVAGYDLLFIDEAQKIPDIGLSLKIIHDHIPELKVIVSGSSSFELANRLSEPLTGRAWTYTLFPISLSELAGAHNSFELDSKIPELLQFGSYPDIFSIPNELEKTEYLKNVSNAYLYRDILEFGGIKNADKIRDLLRLLAFQTGSLVSFNELGNSLQLSTQTVQSYVDLLQKSFVIFPLRGFSRNLRKEVIKNQKFYFFDLGIRNAILDNFNPPDQRADIGAIWENFLILERWKTLHYNRKYPNKYFWRTYTGAELDYVEESGGKLFGYEFKWGKKTAKAPATWLETYQEASFQNINSENYQDFILSDI